MDEKSLLDLIREMRKNIKETAKPSIAMQQFEQEIEKCARNRRPTDYSCYKENYAWNGLSYCVVGAELY